MSISQILLDAHNYPSQANEPTMCQAMTIDTPERFLCPISMTIMSHPVRTEAGHVFERQAIMEWIYFGKATCPMSRMPLHPSAIKPDHALEQEIRQWKLENKIPVESEPDDEDEELDEPLVLPKPTVILPKSNMSHLMSLRAKVLQSRDRRAASFEKRSM